MAKITDPLYIIPDNPIYDPKIRELQNTDPANAETVFNPLFSKIINNVHAVKLVEDAEKTKTDRHIADKANPHALNKAQVGLGNVDNIKQAAKTDFDGHVSNGDIHTSAAEKARLDQELGGKNGLFDHGDTPTDLKVYLPNGTHRCTKWLNAPPGAVDVQGNCDVKNYSSGESYLGWTDRLYTEAHGGIWNLHASGGVWGVWQKLAAATSPQEFDFLLFTGYIKMDSHACGFSKSQDGTVVVHIAIKHTSGSLPRGYNSIGQLPVGFRPGKIIGTKYPTGGIFINPDGSLNTAFSEDYVEIIETLVFRTFK